MVVIRSTRIEEPRANRARRRDSGRPPGAPEDAGASHRGHHKARAGPRRSRVIPHPESAAATRVMIKNHGSRARESRSSKTRQTWRTAISAKGVAVVTRYAFIEASGSDTGPRTRDPR